MLNKAQCVVLDFNIPLPKTNIMTQLTKPEDNFAEPHEPVGRMCTFITQKKVYLQNTRANEVHMPAIMN